MKKFLFLILFFILTSLAHAQSQYVDDSWFHGSGKVTLTKITDNVGIGTSVASQKLYVNGTTSSTAYISSGSLTGQSNYISSNVGIGTNTPQYALDVNGTAQATNYVSKGALTGQANYLAANVGIGTNAPYNAALGIQGNTYLDNLNGNNLFFNLNGNNFGGFYNNTSFTDSILFFGSGTDYTAIPTVFPYILSLDADTGNVGIGTFSGSNQLVVGGTAEINGFKLDGNGATSGYVLTSDSSGNGTWQASSGGGGAQYWIQSTPSNIGIGTFNNVGIGTITASSGQLVIVNQNPTVGAPGVYTNGNIGIGTWLPNAALSVMGNVGIGTTLGDKYLMTTPPVGGEIMYGNLGIGTWVPGSALVVKSGNVGIGTNSAPNALYVVGTAQATAFTGAGTGLTGTASSLTSGTVTTNANLTGDVTSSGNATTLKNTGTAGTYRSTTFDSAGRETSGANPTTFSGYGLSDTSANLAAALTDESGTGVSIFGTAPTFTTSITMSAANLITDTTTGTKIGTGTTQKLGFYNASPVVQQTGNVCTAMTNLGLVTSCTESGGGSSQWITNGVQIGTVGVVNIGTTGTGSSQLNIIGNLGIGTSAGDAFNSNAAPNGGMIVFGNVGLGTFAPSSKLSVNGGETVGTSYASVVAPTNGMFIQGNVGIGTTVPLQGGLIVENGNVGIGTWIPISPLANTGTSQRDINSVGGNAQYGITWMVPSTSTAGGYVGTLSDQKNNSNANGLLINIAQTATTSNALEVESGTSSRLSVLGNGNVGIGTYLAGSLFTVSGGGTFGSGDVANVAPANGLLVQGNVGIGTTLPTHILEVGTSGQFAVDSSGNLTLASSTTANENGAILAQPGTTTGNAWHLVCNSLSSGVCLQITGSSGSLSGNMLQIGYSGAGSGTNTLFTSSSASASGPVISIINSGSGLNLSVGSNKNGLSANFAGNVGIGTAVPTGFEIEGKNVGIGTWNPSAALAVNGSISYIKNAPTITSCGTTPSGSVVGSDSGGTITVGGTATGCTATFVLTHTGTHCVFSNQSMSITSPLAYTESSTGFVLSQAVGLSGDILDYNCSFDN